MKGTLAVRLLTVMTVALTVSMVAYPEPAFKAAVEGLRIWWEIVFPALLPFFVAAEILMGLGVVHGMGVLLEPLMRPLFNVPGAGSFAMAMGLASGYPLGAVLAGKLRRQQLVNKHEAERLMSFTNTADPLFMSGAVAVGMFGEAGVAGVLMIAHYLASVAVGLLMRFHAPQAPVSPLQTLRRGPLLARALAELHAAREQDGRPFGQLMGEAVTRSVQTLLLIGGFIIMFAAIIRILTLTGVVSLLAYGFTALLGVLGLNSSLSPALCSGLFEITLGTNLAARAPALLRDRLIAASVIIAWSGLSVHAQVASVNHDTDINMRPYVTARLLHGIIAGLFTGLFLGPLQALTHLWSVPALAAPAHPTWGAVLALSAQRCLGAIVLLPCLGLLVSLPRLHLNKGRRP